MLDRYWFMKRLITALGLMVTIVLWTPTMSPGQETEVIAGGELEFQRSCASCHGQEGKGNGPMAKVLTVKPADLTQLSKGNGGTFPFWRVYGTIDGREQVQSHGPREMPIWGERFNKETSDHGSDARSLVAGRILGLVFYLRHIQRN